MLLITKFNKLIRSKVIWSMIAGVIIVSFVWYGAAGNNTDSGPRRRGEGTLYGESVSFRQFQYARSFELGFRDPSKLTEDQNQQLKKQVWTRLALIESGKRMGLTSSREDVLAAIESDPMFQSETGGFDSNRFNVILKQYIKVPESVFYEYKRQEVILGKVYDILYSSVWASPYEMMQNISDLADIFVVQYVAIPTKRIISKAKVRKEDIEKFYGENKELLRIPEQTNVKYVSFPFTNYLTIVNVTDDQIEEYYNDNIDKYWITDTNSTNSATIQTPLEDVKEDIESELLTLESIFAARDAAMQFVVAIAPDRHGDAPSFDDAAATSDLIVKTSSFFSESDTPDELDVGDEFSAAALRLNSARIDEYFSDPIRGEHSVYVIAANEKRASRIPELDEVKDVVTSLAKRQAEEQALDKESERVKSAIENELASGKTFEDAADDVDLDVVTTEPFSVYMGPVSNEFDHAEAIMPEVAALQQGELLAAPIAVDGALLIGYISSREPVDISTIQMLRPRVQSAMDQYRTQMLFQDWGQYALKAADFVDLSVQDDLEEEDEGGE